MDLAWDPGSTTQEPVTLSTLLEALALAFLCKIRTRVIDLLQRMARKPGVLQNTAQPQHKGSNGERAVFALIPAVVGN